MFHFCTCVIHLLSLLLVCVYTLIRVQLFVLSCTVSLETNYLTGLRKVSGTTVKRMCHTSMFPRHAECVFLFVQCACVYYSLSGSLLAHTLMMNMAFWCRPLIILGPQSPQKTLHRSTRMFVVFGCWCHTAIAIHQNGNIFWMCLSHLVTIGGTDRGAVGQSGIGVLE